MGKFNGLHLTIIAAMVAIVCWTYYESTICEKYEYIYSDGRQYTKSYETYKCECNENERN